MEQQDLFLSCVIPAFNEASRLPESLPPLRAWADAQSWAYEVLVVDDGSADDTAGVVTRMAREWAQLRLVRGPHQGKGGAVRAGVLAAQGQHVALADADFSMPAKEFSRFLVPPAADCDVALGSREAPGAMRFSEPGYRHIMGRVFDRLVQVAVLPGIEDTQCGFKLMRHAVAVDLCQHQTLTGWGFDVELLVIARERGYSLCEVPIPWHYMAGSRVNPIRDTLTMVADVAHVWRNRRAGIYAKGLTPQAGRAETPAGIATPAEQ
ncbi:MAG TPA: glycosyltransferase [Ktedonobacterales bacterium]